MKFARVPTAMLVPALAALSTLLAAAPASAQFRCPPGYMRNRFGRCIPFNNRVCPPGQVFQNGMCVFIAQPQPVACPAGFFWSNGRCWPQGQPIQQPMPVACPPGTMLMNGVCTAVQQPVACPAGYAFINGACRPAGMQPNACPPGWFYFRGRCRPR